MIFRSKILYLDYAYYRSYILIYFVPPRPRIPQVICIPDSELRLLIVGERKEGM